MGWVVNEWMVFESQEIHVARVWLESGGGDSNCNFWIILGKVMYCVLKCQKEKETFWVWIDSMGSIYDIHLLILLFWAYYHGSIYLASFK